MRLALVLLKSGQGLHGLLQQRVSHVARRLALRNEGLQFFQGDGRDLVAVSLVVDNDVVESFRNTVDAGFVNLQQRAVVLVRPQLGKQLADEHAGHLLRHVPLLQHLVGVHAVALDHARQTGVQIDVLAVDAAEGDTKVVFLDLLRRVAASAFALLRQYDGGKVSLGENPRRAGFANRAQVCVHALDVHQVLQAEDTLRTVHLDVLAQLLNQSASRIAEDHQLRVERHALLARGTLALAVLRAALACRIGVDQDAGVAPGHRAERVFRHTVAGHDRGDHIVEGRDDFLPEIRLARFAHASDVPGLMAAHCVGNQFRDIDLHDRAVGFVNRQQGVGVFLVAEHVAVFLLLALYPRANVFHSLALAAQRVAPVLQLLRRVFQVGCVALLHADVAVVLVHRVLEECFPAIFAKLLSEVGAMPDPLLVALGQVLVLQALLIVRQQLCHGGVHPPLRRHAGTCFEFFGPVGHRHAVGVSHAVTVLGERLFHRVRIFAGLRVPVLGRIAGRVSRHRGAHVGLLMCARILGVRAPEDRRDFNVSVRAEVLAAALVQELLVVVAGVGADFVLDIAVAERVFAGAFLLDVLLGGVVGRGRMARFAALRLRQSLGVTPVGLQRLHQLLVVLGSDDTAFDPLVLEVLKTGLLRGCTHLGNRGVALVPLVGAERCRQGFALQLLDTGLELTAIRIVVHGLLDTRQQRAEIGIFLQQQAAGGCASLVQGLRRVE